MSVELMEVPYITIFYYLCTRIAHSYGCITFYTDTITDEDFSRIGCTARHFASH